jgi:hypothetical protein
VPKPLKIPYRLVRVDWEDSGSDDNRWHRTDNREKPQAMMCVSVGYLIAKTKHTIQITANFSGVRGTATHLASAWDIPRSAVRSITDLNK